MFKRIIAIILISIMMLLAFVGCLSEEGTKTEGNSSSNTSTQETTTTEMNKYEKEIVVSAAKRPVEIVNIENNLEAKMLKEKFNLVINKTEIPGNDYQIKMSMLFASGDAPEFLYSLRPEWNLNEWVTAGYIKGFTVDELKNKFPNYLKIYLDEEWNNVYGNIRYTDDKVYYLPGKRSSKVNMSWIYRVDTLDSLGKSYPKTADEMYDLMKSIKDKTGRVPYVSADTTCLWAFAGFLQMFGMPELIVRTISYVDPVSGTFVPFAFSENNYREFLKYMNKSYKEGLIWQEFATANKEQTKKFQSQGNGYIQWAYPEKIAEYNNISRNADADANWDWAKDLPTAYPEKGVYFKREPYFNADGIGFYAKISDEKMERMLDYLNWALTEEGIVFNTYGVEGVTYEKKDGKYKYMDHMITPIQAKGDKAGKYGIVGASGFMVTHPQINEVYRPVVSEVEKTFLNKEGYYFHMASVFRFTDEENKRLADIQTSIIDARDEYAARFIMGQMDPNNDADWEKYIRTLEKLGLEDLKKLRTDAYNRANK